MGLLDVFIERDKKPEKEKKKPDLSAVGIPPNHSVRVEIHPDPAPVTYRDYSRVDEETKTIVEQLKKETKDGCDYTKFIATKEALTALSSDSLKYSSAFAALSVSGLTKEGLLTAAQSCKDIITKEGKDFENGYQAAYDQSVGSLKKIIDQKSQELAAAVEKVNALNDQIRTTKDQLDANQGRLENKRESFQQAVSIVISEIDGEVNKINQYIK